LTEGKILDLLEDCKVQVGVQTILGVIVTDKVKSPALFGVVRPRLLLPEGMLETLSAEELRYVFLHELAHLKRHDIYLGWLMVVLQVLHWFNPLVWLAFGRMRADRELACDGLVLSTMGSDKSQAYGRTLVNLFKGFSGLQYVPGIAGVLENKSQLKRRITMIARFKKGSYRWSILAIVLLAVLGFVVLTNAKGTPQAESKEPTALTKEGLKKIVKQAVLTISTCAETDSRVAPVLESLQELDNNAAVKELVKYLDSDRNTIRRSAIYILWKGNFKSIEPAAASLQNLCSHEEHYTRGMAALALGANKIDSGFDTLADMTLKDSDAYARRCAAYGLGLMGRAEAKPILEKALKDSDFNVRNNAEAALTMLSQIDHREEMVKKTKTTTATKSHKRGANKRDVQVEDFKIRPYEAGGLYTVTAAIRNNGQSDVPHFRLNFYRGNPADNLNLHGKKQTGTHGAGPIKPGDVWNERSGAFALKEGLNEISVVLDIDNTIAESDETNNSATMKVIIRNGQITEKSVAYSPQGPKTPLSYEELLKKKISVSVSHSPEGEKLSVQYAVIAVCEAAGIPYKWQKSSRLAGQERTRYIGKVQFDNIEVRQALGEILDPVGLVYRLDHDGLYILKVGGFCRTDEIRKTKKVELSHDDGKSAGKWSFAGGGHAVRFKAPSEGCILKAVRLYGSRYGEYEMPDEDFDVWVCDSEFNVIKNCQFPYSKFKKRGYTKWANLTIEPIEVPQEFVICAAFDPHKTKGIYVYHDKESTGNSFTGLPGSSMEPFNKGDWMIRAVVGTREAEKISTKVDKLEAENLSVEGWNLWRQRKLVEAEAKFKQAVEKDPTNDGAYQGLGWAQLNQGKKLNAKDSFEKCIKIDPKNSAALNGLGWIAHGQGNKGEAITWWEKAIAANPGATASLNGLTQVYMERKQYDKAVKYYNMWLAVEPGNAQAKAGLEKAEAGAKDK